jgi:hypothetical protein
LSPKVLTSDKAISALTDAGVEMNVGEVYFKGGFKGEYLSRHFPGFKIPKTLGDNPTLTKGDTIIKLVKGEDELYSFAENGIAKTSWFTRNAGLINLAVTIGVAILVYNMLSKEVSYKVVTFSCQPWQAPTGGNRCEDCNDKDLQCSKYRCKSLGQNCELVNQGTEQEKCVNINPRDTNFPIITPNEDELSYGYEYTDIKISPPGPGFKIIGQEQECVKAFTPLKFGIDTNEPAQCKIDLEHTTGFDEMNYWFGGSNLYLYNHTEQFSLPGAEAFENSSLVLENGKDLNFFIRCRDKNGNENTAEYEVRFCVDPSPDNTAPKIQATSIENKGCINADTDKTEVEFYTNEPAECRWSFVDQDFDSMDNTMVCSSQVYETNALQLYTCKTELTGISRDLTDFYVRCKDQPGKQENERNENKQSYKFSLRGSTELKIKNLQPNGTIYGSIDPAPVELFVETLFG